MSISDIISTIANSRAGWITPRLDVLPCEKFEHMDVILGHLEANIVQHVPEALRNTEQLKDGLEIRGTSLTIYRMPIPQA